MYEVIFLWALALIYIIFAVVQDIRTKEIANWINFSLAIFALGFRFFYSLFQSDGFVFFYNGLIGLAIFFVIGNLLYYGKVFAGGDAKLMISLGTILPYSPSIISNLQGFFNFILVFLFSGFLYIFISSTFFCIKNFKSFKKEFLNQLKKNKKLMILTISISVLLSLFGFVQKLAFLLGLLVFFASYLFLYSKAIDESCMVKRIKACNLREGDWLYSDLKIGNRTINAKWEGVSKKEMREIEKKYKEIRIRQGIAFSPVFLISFIVFVIFVIFKLNLWDPFW
jgi:Flp pilus assembly protein protease CpaA